MQNKSHYSRNTSIYPPIRLIDGEVAVIAFFEKVRAKMMASCIS